MIQYTKIAKFLKVSDLNILGMVNSSKNKKKMNSKNISKDM
jgi:hypothetical protein